MWPRDLQPARFFNQPTCGGKKQKAITSFSLGERENFPSKDFFRDYYVLGTKIEKSETDSE